MFEGTLKKEGIEVDGKGLRIPVASSVAVPLLCFYWKNLDMDDMLRGHKGDVWHHRRRNAVQYRAS